MSWMLKRLWLVKWKHRCLQETPLDIKEKCGWTDPLKTHSSFFFNCITVEEQLQRLTFLAVTHSGPHIQLESISNVLNRAAGQQLNTFVFRCPALPLPSHFISLFRFICIVVRDVTLTSSPDNIHTHTYSIMLEAQPAVHISDMEWLWSLLGFDSSTVSKQRRRKKNSVEL